jgi:hypothetical protein
MAGPVIKAKLLRWGNSYGLRIAKADVERLGLRVGDEVDWALAQRTDRIDVSHIPTFKLGRDTGKRHDEILNKMRWEKIKRSQDDE